MAHGMVFVEQCASRERRVGDRGGLHVPSQRGVTAGGAAEALEVRQRATHVSG